MSTKINSKICYASVGTMSRSGSMITVKLFSEKADAAAIYTRYIDGQHYIRVGEVATGYETFEVDGWYQRGRSSVQMHEAYAEITLVFDQQNVQGLSPTSGSNDRYDPVYDLSTSTAERPIEQHPNFLCKWTYNLYELIPVTGGTPSAVPAWAATDNNPAGGTRTAPIVRENYLWAQNPPAAPDAEHKYVQVLAATDYGMNTYLVPRPVVTSTVYYKTRNVQTSDIKNVGQLKAPADTYIYGSSNTQWLITNGSVQDASDDMRAVTTSYTYNEDHWKTKVYQEAPAS